MREDLLAKEQLDVGASNPDEEIEQDVHQRIFKLSSSPTAAIIEIQKTFAQLEKVQLGDHAALEILARRFQELADSIPALAEKIQQQRRLDLHVHADGFLDLRELTQKSVQAGVAVLINTDHNMLDHQPRLRSLAKQEGLFFPFDGSELTLLAAEAHKFHLKLYSDPADYQQLAPLV